MYFYAQLDDNDIVDAISCLLKKEKRENLIEIIEYDENLLGKKYNRSKGIFEEIEKSKPILSPEQIRLKELMEKKTLSDTEKLEEIHLRLRGISV